jgi:hypothetical protein
MSKVKYMVEKQWNDVTPKQAQSLAKRALFKVLPQEQVCQPDIMYVANEAKGNTHYEIIVKDKVKKTVDYTVDNLVRVNYDPNGSGEVVDFESKYYEYKKQGYKTTTEETDEEDFVEIYKDKQGHTQFYHSDKNGTYNQIIEFDYHSKTSGSCYFYEVQSEK